MEGEKGPASSTEGPQVATRDSRASDQKEATGCAYVLYYLVLFFAYWFGVHRFDRDGDGDFDADDVQAYLNDKKHSSRNFKKKAKKQVIAAMDKDGDGNVGVGDLTHVEGGLSTHQVAQEGLKNQVLPWFITFQCVMCFGLWAGFAVADFMDHGGDPLQKKGGMDNFDKSMTDLRLTDNNCADYRWQVWRWVSYEWTHIGAMHVTMNVLLNLILGIPLEGLHGAPRMAVMYNIGVIGGACCYFFNDAHSTVVGCSGGCYALIGLHVADLLLNWSQNKFRWPTVAFLALLMGFDICTYILALGAENASHSAHMGGGIAGLFIGVLIGHNITVKTHEYVFMGAAFILGLGCLLFSILWLVFNPAPLNIWEAMQGENGYCWFRQVYNGTLGQWVCVRCGDQDCINSFQDHSPTAVNAATCYEVGWHYDGR